MLDILNQDQGKDSEADCIDRLEKLILSGDLDVGQKLPPQRLLAEQMGVGRPVIKAALQHLAANGMVKIIPRVGTVVSDYRKEGAIAMLTSLLKYERGNVAPKLLDGLLDIRGLVEIEITRLAANYRSDDHIRALRRIIAAEEQLPIDAIDQTASLNFEFHHTIAMASGNPIYPILLNSFRSVYTSLSAISFGEPQVISTVIGFQRDTADAIENQQSDLAVAAMRCLLSNGEDLLREKLERRF